MLARFSVAYEVVPAVRSVAIFVVNVAILAHTLMGAVVLGFLPLFAAAQATFRAWVLSEDRSKPGPGSLEEDVPRLLEASQARIFSVGL